MSEQTGAGFVVYGNKNRTIREEHYRLPDRCTVFQAEVTAVDKAATFLLQMLEQQPLKFVKIFIDSQAAIRAIACSKVHSKTVKSARDKLQTVALRTRTVTLAWTPAHRGYHGNSRADNLAKLGSSTSECTRQLQVCCPVRSITGRPL